MPLYLADPLFHQLGERYFNLDDARFQGVGACFHARYGSHLSGDLMSPRLLSAIEYRLYHDDKVIHQDEFPEADHDYENEGFVTVMVPVAIEKYIADSAVESELGKIEDEFCSTDHFQ